MDIISISYKGQKLKTICSAGQNFCLHWCGIVIPDRILFNTSDGESLWLDPPHFRGLCKRLSPSNAIKINDKEYQVVINDGLSEWKNWFNVEYEKSSWGSNCLGFDITDDWLLNFDNRIQRLDNFVFDTKFWSSRQCEISVGKQVEVLEHGGLPTTRNKITGRYLFTAKDEKLKQYIRLFKIIYKGVSKDIRTFELDKWHPHEIDSSYIFHSLVDDKALYYRGLDFQLVSDNIKSKDNLFTWEGNFYDIKNNRFSINNPKTMKEFFLRGSLVHIFVVACRNIHGLDYFIKKEDRAHTNKVFVVDGVGNYWMETSWVKSEEKVLDFNKNYVVIICGVIFIIRKSDNKILAQYLGNDFKISNGYFYACNGKARTKVVGVEW